MYSYGPATYGWAKAGQPARTYIQQLCEDMGCSPEELPEAMNDREKWRERVRDTRASGSTWWWWWWSIDRTLSVATTMSQSGPGNDGNEGVLHIPQSSSITIRLFSVISLPLCRGAVGVFYTPSRLGNIVLWYASSYE